MECGTYRTHQCQSGRCEWTFTAINNSNNSTRLVDYGDRALEEHWMGRPAAALCVDLPRAQQSEEWC